MQRNYDKLSMVMFMTIVFKVSDKLKEKMIKYYEDKRRIKTTPYAVFQADDADTIVTLYESGKVMFQGISADIDAKMWSEMEEKLTGKKINIYETRFIRTRLLFLCKYKQYILLFKSFFFSKHKVFSLHHLLHHFLSK